MTDQETIKQLAVAKALFQQRSLLAMLQKPPAQSKDDQEPPWDCEGCGGGDKWPSNQAVWVCPACDTEYRDMDASEAAP